MALEDKFDQLIAAVEKNTAAIIASTQMRDEIMAVAKGAADAPAEKPKADKPKAEKKAEPKAETKPEPETASEDDVAYAGLRDLIAEYLGVERSEERAARQQKVIALLNHEKIKKPDVPADAKPDTMNIAPGSIELFKSQMKMLKEKGDLTTPASDSLV